MAGTPKNRVGLKFEKLASRFLMLEAFQQTHAASADEPAVQAVAKAVHVEKRQGEQETIGARYLPARQQIERVRRHIVVRQNGAFGNAGSAGSIDDSCRSIAIKRNWRPLVPECSRVAREIRRIPDRHRAGKFTRGDHSNGLGVREDMGQLALAVKDVDRDENHAQLEACEIQIDDLQAVGQVDAKPIAGFEPAPRPAIGQPIAARVDIAKRIAGALEFKRRMVAAADEGEIEEVEGDSKAEDTTPGWG